MPSLNRPIFVFANKALLVVLGLPQALAFLPAITLGAFWAGGELALLLTALAVPLLLAFTGMSAQANAERTSPTSSRRQVTETLDTVLRDPGEDGTAAAIALALEGLEDLRERFGPPAADLARQRVAERLTGALRGRDVIARLDDTTFGIAVGPTRRADLEALLTIAGRLQDAVRDPISIDRTSIHLSSSIGFCLTSRSPAPNGDAMLGAAETALREASQNGPGAIRAYSADMQRAVSHRLDLAGDIATALADGGIRPWFQPQISTDTGAVTGFEALARWQHPTRGLVPPTEFLPELEQAGLSEQLSEVILFQSFMALRSWDKAGIDVPTVGVNFSASELRNPTLVDKIRWELDRFNLTPERLTVEILETVVSDASDDIITRNIAALSELGCGVDLDDFGTGHASIATIRRFAIARLKIDRSFVTRVDQDREQQDMVAAILTMAERLHLSTLAEGVETLGEHAMLAQLGCEHVQGFGIARPMPFEETIAWVLRHQEKLGDAAVLGRQAG